jgi:hypothetical protein
MAFLLGIGRMGHRLSFGLKCRNVQVDHNILMFSECARYASEVKVLQARIPVGLTAEAEELKGQEDHPLRSPASRNEIE